MPMKEVVIVKHIEPIRKGIKRPMYLSGKNCCSGWSASTMGMMITHIVKNANMAVETTIRKIPFVRSLFEAILFSDWRPKKIKRDL